MRRFPTYRFAARFLGAAFLAFVLGSLAFGQAPESSFVNIKTVDPTIVVDLRYASERNVTHRVLYPSHMPALVRAGVAERLVAAQKFLRARGFGLKIWDAYRPRSAQAQLWELTHQTTFVADPNGGVGSLHTRGVAVDVTLVDSWGRDVPMPTDFDNFTAAAVLVYRGDNPSVRFNLQMLQRAMGRTGFYGLRNEWWHFCAEDWAKYSPMADGETAPQAL